MDPRQRAICKVSKMVASSNSGPPLPFYKTFAASAIAACTAEVRCVHREFVRIECTDQNHCGCERSLRPAGCYTAAGHCQGPITASARQQQVQVRACRRLRVGDIGASSRTGRAPSRALLSMIAVVCLVQWRPSRGRRAPGRFGKALSQVKFCKCVPVCCGLHMPASIDCARWGTGAGVRERWPR